jgi:DNA-binding CsgD family transcriptional regulator
MDEPYTFGNARHGRRPVTLYCDKYAPDVALRKTGFNLLGEVPWGAHLCLFYDTNQDLLDTNVEYFNAGLESSERGLWVVSDPIRLDEATEALRRRIPDFDRHLACGNIELASGPDWYLPEGKFELKKIIHGWHQKYYGALASGYEGLRISGNALWQHTGFWNEFCEYERELDKSLIGHQMLALCTYSLGRSPARDLLEVARAHQCTIVRRNGDWNVLQVPTLDQTRNDIRVFGGDLDVLSQPFPGRELLTPREKLVLAQIIRGASSKKVARTLEISPRTVEFHRANIMQKLDVKNSIELVCLVLGEPANAPRQSAPAS